jgi:hypothetical protein
MIESKWKLTMWSGIIFFQGFFLFQILGVNGILECNFGGPHINVSSQPKVIFVFQMTLNSHI